MTVIFNVQVICDCNWIHWGANSTAKGHVYTGSPRHSKVWRLYNGCYTIPSYHFSTSFVEGLGEPNRVGSGDIAKSKAHRFLPKGEIASPQKHQRFLPKSTGFFCLWWLKTAFGGSVVSAATASAAFHNMNESVTRQMLVHRYAEMVKQNQEKKKKIRVIFSCFAALSLPLVTW